MGTLYLTEQGATVTRTGERLLVRKDGQLLQDMPALHGDPAGRMIVAAALTGHQLVTADRRILDWPGQLNKLGATK